MGVEISISQGSVGINYAEGSACAKALWWKDFHLLGNNFSVLGAQKQTDMGTE